MKRVKAALIGVVLGFIIGWLLIAMIIWDVNLANWTMVQRGMIVLITFICIMVSFLFEDDN